MVSKFESIQPSRREMMLSVDELIPSISPEQPRASNVQKSLNGVAEDVILRTESYASTFLDHVISKLKLIEMRPDEKESYRKGKVEALEKLHGQIVVDLGAGDSVSGYLTATLFNARAYIAVEPINHDSLKNLLEERTKHNEDLHVDSSIPKVKAIPFSVVADDALAFLRRLPDKSVSVVANGLDSLVLLDLGPAYSKDVAREIERVLHPGGVYVNDSSDFFLNPKDFDSVRDDVGSLSVAEFYTRKK